MAINPLAVSRAPGMQPGAPAGPVPGLNTRPYPTLGPAQGGIGPGAEQSPPQEGGDGKDKLAEMASLMSLFGIKPGSQEAIYFAAGNALPSLSRMAAKNASRGSTQGGQTEADLMAEGAAMAGGPGMPDMPPGGPGMPPPPRVPPLRPPGVSFI